MFTTIKTYATAIVAGVIGVLLVAVRVLTGRNRRLKKKNERMEAQRKHTKLILEQDIVIDEQTDIHLSEVAREVESGNHPSELTQPNDPWLPNDKDHK